MAGVIIVDRFTVINIFTRPLQGLSITVPTSAVILIGLSPIIEWPGLQIFIFAMLAGFFLQAAQACYFISMEYVSEAADLSAIESTYPVLIAIVSIFLGDYLHYSEIIGILIIFISIFALTWNRKIALNKYFFGFLAGDILFLASHALVADYVLHDTPFLSFYGPYSLSIVVFGALPFAISKKEREMLVSNFLRIQEFLPRLCLIEVGNTAAVLSATYALSIGHPALVTSVMTTYPALVFLGSHIIYGKMKNVGFIKTQNILRKLIAIAFISIGLAMLTT